MKASIRKRASRILVVLLVVMLSSYGFAGITCYANTEDDNQLYDIIPIFANGEEGEVVHAKEITVQGSSGGGGTLPGMGGGTVLPGMPGGSTGTTEDTTFYLVQLPEGVKAIKLFGGEVSKFNIPDVKLGTIIIEPGKIFDADNYAKNNWWTIDTSELKWNWFQTNDAYNNGLTKCDEYCPEAEYFELENDKDTDKPLFIQIGDEDSPLDVLASEDGGSWTDTSFEQVSLIELYLCTGKRHEEIESNYEIYYTVDGTDPLTSDSAIKYTDCFTVTRSCTVLAAVKMSDDKWGPVSMFSCTLESNSPVISPSGGSFVEPFDAVINSGIDDAKIYYTTDGSDPFEFDDWTEEWSQSSSAKEYNDKIRIDKDTTLKAVSVISDYDEKKVSEIITAEYRFSTGIKVDMNGDNQGVWLKEGELNATKKATIITPFGKSKCNVVISLTDGASMTVDDNKVSPEESGENKGKYLVELNVRENADLYDFGQENIITVENGEESETYTIYCIASKFPDVPDAITDYYVPASQFTNNGYYGTAPNRTLIGKPQFNNASSLGNFGGYITWYYKDGIENNPKNPYGVDFIVIGNSFDGTNEAAEPGNILVSENGTEWYTLAGSIHYDDNAIWNQKVTYSKENGLSAYSFEDSDIEEDVSRFFFPEVASYPLHNNPEDFSVFSTTGVRLIPEKGVNTYGNVRPPYPAFGYADVGGSTHCSNEAENPYGGIIRDKDYPDRVKTNRNGDACDISWAVDENGNPKQLNEIHYVKVQTASFIDNGAIGEKSTEVNVMRIAKPADSVVGTTAAPSSIKIDGASMELEPGEMVNVDVSGVFDVAVDAPEDTNVYINSLRSHTAFMDKAPHGIVRVIVQEGEKEPLIYYFNINQNADDKTVTKVTLDAGKGLLQDKEKVDCYFDEDTFEHVGEDGTIALPEAAPANNKQAFLTWYDKSDETKTYAELQASDLNGTDVVLSAKFAKAADVEAAKEVEALIDALPELDAVEGTDSAAISEAREAYDELTDDQKALVSESAVTKLTELEAVISGKVEAMIDALPAPSEITEDDADAVKAAKEAYEGLSDTGKAAISDAKTSKLFQAAAAVYQAEAEAAQAKVENLEGQVASLQAEAAAAAQKVAEAEAKLKELEESGEADKEAIKKAQEELEAAKKEMADAEGKLKKAEEDLAAAKKKASDAEAAAKQVADSYEEELALLKAQNAILKKSVKKLKAKAKKKSALVSWKKVGSGFTYEVYRSTNPTKSFKKVKTSKKLKVTVKKLKKGKTYYFKARAFKKVGGKKVYTGWSNIAKAKIKK